MQVISFIQVFIIIHTDDFFLNFTENNANHQGIFVFTTRWELIHNRACFNHFSINRIKIRENCTSKRLPWFSFFRLSQKVFNYCVRFCFDNCFHFFSDWKILTIPIRSNSENTKRNGTFCDSRWSPKFVTHFLKQSFLERGRNK